jgi:hypothetical protein
MLPDSGGTGDVMVAGWPDDSVDPATSSEVVPLAAPGSRLPVTAVVYPASSSSVSSASPRLTPCRPGSRFASLVESSFDSGTFGWNPLIERSPSLPSFVAIAVSRVGELPAYELTGDGPLTAAVVDRLLG